VPMNDPVLTQHSFESRESTRENDHEQREVGADHPGCGSDEHGEPTGDVELAKSAVDNWQSSHET
jgi:hypothetical protein